MRIGVLGTGMVGATLASGLVGIGHEVMMGARSATSDKAAGWAQAAGAKAGHGDFAAAAAFAELAIVAVLGTATLEVARLAGAQNLAGKVVIDTTNPLDFSQGMPATLIPDFANTTSLGEALQAALPGARLVKALNTMSHRLMVEPARVPGVHDVFLCGDDEAAKAAVIELLRSFGWTSFVDLGPLSAARATEGLMPFWLRLMGRFGGPDFNYHMVRAE